MIKKFFGFSIGSWVNALIGFITVPTVTRLISTSENGKFTMFTHAGAVALILITVGLDQAYIRFYNEDSNKPFLLRRTILPCVLISATLSIIFLIFHKPITGYLYEKESLRLAILTVVSVFCQLFNRFVMLTLRMEQLGGMYSTLQIISRVSYFGLFLFFCYFLNPNAQAMMYATIASLIITIVIGMFYQHNLWRGALVIENKNSKITNKQIWSYSAPLMVSTATMSMLTSMDAFIIRTFGTNSELGIYNAAYKIVSLINIVQTSFSTFWVPVAYNHYNEQPENRKFFSIVHDLLVVVFFLLAIFIISCKDLIGYLLGPDYREAVYIMPVMVFQPVFYTLSEISGMGIYFKKKSSYQIICSGVAALALAIGSYFLLPALGIRGVSISLALAYITYYILRSAIGKKCYDMEIHFGKLAAVTVVTFIYAVWCALTPFDWRQLILGAFDLFLLFIFYHKRSGEAIKSLLR